MTGARAARRILRRQGMPSEEIRAVLGAEDPEVVRRYLELHRERMEERLAEELRAVASLERRTPATALGGALRGTRLRSVGDRDVDPRSPEGPNDRRRRLPRRRR